jgi:predicted XRE-type DNA-binding protein
MDKDDNTNTKSSGNVFIDLGFPPEEATVMHMRIEMMTHINKKIRDNGWGISDVADQLSITQLEVDQLLKTDLDSFNLDKLLVFAIKTGLRVRLDWRSPTNADE